MARHTEAVCKLCRREGEKLFLKGDRCYTHKCSVGKRAYAPGQHGQLRKKLSGYGVQLREKQKARRYYGVLENQFRSYFEMAVNKKGVTGTVLLQILESRLDNVVYRLGFADSRTQARQLVTHGHISVNGRRVDIPSYLVKPGETIAIYETSKNIGNFAELADKVSAKVIPAWLDLDKVNLTAKVVGVAAREDIDLLIQEHLIVELYSK